MTCKTYPQFRQLCSFKWESYRIFTWDYAMALRNEKIQVRKNLLEILFAAGSQESHISQVERTNLCCTKVWTLWLEMEFNRVCINFISKSRSFLPHCRKCRHTGKTANPTMHGMRVGSIRARRFKRPPWLGQKKKQLAECRTEKGGDQPQNGLVTYYGQDKDFTMVIIKRIENLPRRCWSLALQTNLPYPTQGGAGSHGGGGHSRGPQKVVVRGIPPKTDVGDYNNYIDLYLIATRMRPIGRDLPICASIGPKSALEFQSTAKVIKPTLNPTMILSPQSGDCFLKIVISFQLFQFQHPCVFCNEFWRVKFILMLAQSLWNV